RRKQTMRRLFRPAAIVGLAALCGGIAGAAMPARADYDDAHHIRRDIRDIHGDEARLYDLQCRRDDLAARHDWDGVRRINFQSGQLRIHIAEDRRDVHYDIVQARPYYRRDRDDYRYRDEFRYRDRDDYRRRDHDDYRNRNRDDYQRRDDQRRRDDHYRYDG